MDKLKDMDPVQRKAWLEAHCYGHNKETVRRPFTKEEMDDLKETLTENLVIIAKATDELNKAKAIFKDNAGEPKKYVKELTTKLKEESEEVEITLYMIDDQDAGEMRMYDEDGNFYSSRPLYASERQRKLFSAIR